MLRLLLLRHAKAETGGKTNRDHERQLTTRGRANAATMGAWLHTNGYEPGLVLCSDAVRTIETWEIAAQEMDASPRVEFLEQLYLAPAKRIQNLIREVYSADTVLVVGHNPGTEECAIDLTRKPTDKAQAARLEQMREKFPTSGLAVLEFEVAEWRAVAPGGGLLSDFVKPRDLD